MDSNGEICVGFTRLVALLFAGYEVQRPSGMSGGALFLHHPAGRKFKQSRLIIYDAGTVVGSSDEKSEFRIRSFDQDAFASFLQSVPSP